MCVWADMLCNCCGDSANAPEMLLHSPGIRVNAIGARCFAGARTPDARMGVSLKKSRADDGNRILVAFSPNPSYPPRGQPERHRQAASVRPRLLRFLLAVHDSNTTMG